MILAARVARLCGGLLLAACAAAAAAAPERSPAQWLAAMQEAARSQPYVGHVVQQRGAILRSSRVAQRVEGGYATQRVELLDGRPIEFIRQRSPAGDEVRQYQPQARRVVVERRVLETRFPDLIALTPAAIARHYEIRVGGEERVAGHPARVIDLMPRDTLRHAYRLWAARDSGLPLRVELRDGATLLERVGFTDLEFRQPAPAEVAPGWAATDWVVESPAVAAADPAALGWAIVPPPGFVVKSAVLRRLAPGQPPLLQWFLSDGLAHVSVFVADAAAAPAQQAASAGPVAAATRRLGSHQITAVGELSAAGARAAAQSLEYRGPATAAARTGDRP